jgi:hypothetical protein
MAGPHQIWKVDLDKQETSTFAGSGREARKDGLLLDAAFAQPSGLASDGKRLYVADSESNIIRSIEFETGLVTTLVGGDLFDFGDVDGVGNDVRLQHPLGLVAYGDHILIADTYNHTIKELDPGTRTVKSLFGNGPGQLDGSAASFYEPGGLSVANDKLYIADTNNHAIRVVDLKTKTSATLRINGLQPPAISTVAATDSETGPNPEELAVAPQQVGVANEGSLVIQVELPNGYHLNPMAPQRYRVSVEKGFPQFSVLTLGGSGPVVKSKETRQTSKSLKLPIVIPFASSAPGEAELRIQATLFYCREDNTGTCRIKTLVWRAPVAVVKDPAAPTQIKVSGKVTAE